MTRKGGGYPKDRWRFRVYLRPGTVGVESVTGSEELVDPCTSVARRCIRVRMFEVSCSSVFFFFLEGTGV